MEKADKTMVNNFDSLIPCFFCPNNRGQVRCLTKKMRRITEIFIGAKLCEGAGMHLRVIVVYALKIKTLMSCSDARHILRILSLFLRNVCLWGMKVTENYANNVHPHYGAQKWVSPLTTNSVQALLSIIFVSLLFDNVHCDGFQFLSHLRCRRSSAAQQQQQQQQHVHPKKNPFSRFINANACENLLIEMDFILKLIAVDRVRVRVQWNRD